MSHSKKVVDLFYQSKTLFSVLINNSAIKNANEEQNFPTVCFSAYYKHQSKYYLMKETSRFVFEENQWRYLDGEVSTSEELVALKRNERCFCNSNKKFKQCCGL